MELEHGLALVSRVRVLLTFVRTDRSVKPVDEWLLKECVRGLVKKGLKLEMGDKDLVRSDAQKRRRDEPAVSWELYVWNPDKEEVKKSLVRVLDGVELNVGGVKLRCELKIPEQDDFEAMKASWEAVYGHSLSDHHRSRVPDTLAIKGLPSRWFAEPRVSTQASVLVTHTIFSKFGKIRNLEIVGDGDPAAISSALQCQIWIQFERFSGFYKAMDALCGRSMQKDGSTFKANYSVEWDRDAYFNPNNMRKRRFEKEHAQKVANDARLAHQHRMAAEARRAEAAEEARRVEEARRAEAAEEERRAEEARRAQAAEEERLAEAARQALREEEERRQKEEEDERMRQMQLYEEQQRLLEEQRRQEEEAILKRLEEEKRRQEEEAALRRVKEERNKQIREATRKLLQEQEQRKQDELRKLKEEARIKQKETRKGTQEQEALHDMERRRAQAVTDQREREEGSEHERWQLYLSEAEPWPPCTLQINHRQQNDEGMDSAAERHLQSSCKRLRSAIVAAI